jgi:hypothetical protein
MQLVGITFLSLAFSYWIDIPWFHNRGKTCCYIYHTFSWGSQLAGHLHQQHRVTNKFSGAVAGEKEDFCKGSFARTSFTLFIVLLYFIFACIVLSKTHKN